MANRLSVLEFFEQYADDFDTLYGTSRGPMHWLINHVFRRSMKLRFDRTLAACRPLHGKRVLDFGCGPGHYAIALARGGAHEVVGVDFSQRMIDLARRHAEQAGVAEVCRFEQDDVLHYAPERPVDYTVGMGLTDYISDIERLLIQISDNTTEKAVLSFSKASGLLAWQRRMRYRRRCDLFMYTREQIEHMIEQFKEKRRRHVEYSIGQISRDYFVEIEFGERRPE